MNKENKYLFKKNNLWHTTECSVNVVESYKMTWMSCFGKLLTIFMAPCDVRGVICLNKRS